LLSGAPKYLFGPPVWGPMSPWICGREYRDISNAPISSLAHFETDDSCSIQRLQSALSHFSL
jgi:hypothetical protein